MKFTPHILLGVLTLIISFSTTPAMAAEKPVKVYIFAGQSNMGGGINFGTKHADHPAVKWMDSEENDVIYFWDRSGKFKSDQWEKFHYKTDRQGHWEQVTIHSIWQEVKKKDPEQKIAVITVTVGATSLNGFWTSGGRASREGSQSHIKAVTQGKGNKMLEGAIKTALAQLKEKGMKYDIVAFTWYQGEGDSVVFPLAKNYERLLRDLIDGWEVDRDPAKFKDDKALYAGSVAEWSGDKDFNVVVVRVSDKIQGSPKWGDREKWEPALNEVRRALMAYGDGKENAVWVDVDDLPLHDAFHYDGGEYITIGERVAKAHLDLMK